MGRWFGLAVCLCVALPAASGQDGMLRPEQAAVFGGPTATYEVFVGSALANAAGRCFNGVVMVQIPSFRPEQYAGVCSTRDGFVAVSSAPESSLWYSSDASACGGTWCADIPHTIQIVTQRAPLDASVAACVTDVWDRAVRTARYPPHTDVVAMGLDGETTHFASHVGNAEATASVWSPSPEVLAGALVSLGETVGAFARGETPVDSLGAACARVETLLTAETNP